MIEGISAVTLGTHEMPRAVRFYCALGFEVLRGNGGAAPRTILSSRASGQGNLGHVVGEGVLEGRPRGQPRSVKAVPSRPFAPLDRGPPRPAEPCQGGRADS